MHCGVNPCMLQARLTGLGKGLRKMSKNETMERMASGSLSNQQMGSPPHMGTPDGVTGPHFASHSPQVLAQIPDMDSAESEMIDQAPLPRQDGRILSSRMSVVILAGGALLLVLLAVLPFLSGSEETSDPASKQESSAWQQDGPAPSASVAPVWGGAPGEAANWQGEPGAGGFPRPDASGVSAWNDNSQPTNWGNPSEARPWGDQSRSHARGGPSDVPTWPGPLDAQARSGQPDVSVGGNQSHQAAWNGQPNQAPGTTQQPTTSWNSDAQTPSWQSQPYRTAGQAQTQVASPTYPSQSVSAAVEPRQFSPATEPGPTLGPSVPYTPAPYEAGYQAGRPAPAYSDSYHQPQAGTNRSMAIRDYPPADTSGYQADYQHSHQAGYRQDQRAMYRTADARVDFRSGNQANHRTSYQTTDPVAGYPTTGYQRTGYPTSGHPTAGYPTSGYPTSGYPTTDASGGASLTPRYDAGASRQPAEPGVARFRGGIEKPTGESIYDRNRPSIY